MAAKSGSSNTLWIVVGCVVLGLAGTAGAFVAIGAAGALFWTTSSTPVRATQATNAASPDLAPATQAATGGVDVNTPAPAGTAHLSVLSEPAGAEVLVEGRPSGQTPIELEIPAGLSTHLEVRLAGYDTIHHLVGGVGAGQSLVVSLSLMRTAR